MIVLIHSVHCSLLAEDAIKSAIKDYQTKREKRLAMAAVSIRLSLITHFDVHSNIYPNLPATQSYSPIGHLLMMIRLNPLHLSQ